MLDKRENPVAWALLGYELSDAQEHLAQLCQQMQEEPDFDEVNFRIGLAHVYAHLNRAWNRRYLADSQATEAPNANHSLFPTDLEPL